MLFILLIIHVISCLLMHNIRHKLILIRINYTPSSKNNTPKERNSSKNKKSALKLIHVVIQFVYFIKIFM